jgi:hypothetical protein
MRELNEDLLARLPPITLEGFGEPDLNDDPAIKWWWTLAMIAAAGGWVWFCIWAVSRVGT